MTAALPEDKKPSPNAEESANEINSPQIDETTGQPTRKAVESFKQACAICKGVREPALEGRIKTAAQVAKKYNGDTPHDPKLLKDSNQEFRNNFSTQFLPSVVDRVKPQLMDPIQRADRITYATLRPTRENAAEKSRKFGEVITKLVRSWPGWSDFLSLLCQDDVLHGGSIVIRLSPDDWRPRVARYDESFMHEGVGQHATKIPVVMIEQKLLLHEFVDIVRDTDSAKLAGYNIEGCAKAANKSANINTQSADVTALEKEETLREGGVFGHSYSAKCKTVDLWHLLVREYTGGIALWTTDKDGSEIRHVDNLFDSMPDCLAMFTAQTGNGRYYGSKGLGRYLVNLAMAIERLRCLQADQAAMNGMPIAKGDPAQFNGQSVLVHAPFIIIDPSFEVEPNNVLKYNLGELQAVIDKLTEIAESIAGAFIPPNITNEGSPNTKIEAAQKAEREMAVRQGVLGRFFGQFADLMGMIQRAICSPDNIGEAARLYEEWKAKKTSGATMMLRKVFDWLKKAGTTVAKLLGTEPMPATKIADVEAVDALVELMIAGLTPEDIAELALADAGSTVSQNTEERDSQTVQMLQAEAQNPFIDQKASTKVRLTIAIGQDRAEQVVIKDEDPNVEAIAYRQQMLENMEMSAGEAMPVASTDNHAIHKKVVAEKMIQTLSPALDQAPSPEVITIFKLVLQHYADHIELDTTTPEPMKKQEMEIVKQLASKVQAAESALQLAQEAAQKTGTITGPPNTPPGAPAPTGAAPEPSETDKMVHAADIGLRAQDQQLRAKELDLKAQDQAHRQTMDLHKAGLDAQAQAHEQATNIASIQDQRTAAIVDQANTAHEQGMAEAQHDLAKQQAEEQAKQAAAQPVEKA